MSRTVQQTASHAVPGLAPPPTITITPVRPIEQPVPQAKTVERTAGEAPVDAVTDPVVEEPPTTEPDTATAEAETAKAPAQEPATRRHRTTPKVRPTTNADCKGDPRLKHTINLLKPVVVTLGRLQFAQTMKAGREQPLWPHVDAALAVLRPEQCSDTELAKWAERAEIFSETTSDDYEQIGTLLRQSVLKTVRTMRVRLRSIGATDVDVQAVLTTAVVAYLDALIAQGDFEDQSQDWMYS
ncbi:hypothetical protein ACFWYW_46450 [Nonomuraea sp. NPDC059023]|uniref:hypothetical protein n=1 Tax=unclassified Nonomuraea TaxID=2593643 RepID=UPI0036AFD3FD